MKVPDCWSKYEDQYIDGWDFAEGCWADEEPYDPNFLADHLDSDVEREAYQAAYYDFWKSKDFK